MFETNNSLIPIITSNYTKLKHLYCLTVKHFNTIAFNDATIVQCLFHYISNKMQRYTVYLYLETVLHVSGGTSTHHQERMQLYLHHLVFVTPLLLPAAIVEELKPV
jgi:hypothetical protein